MKDLFRFSCLCSVVALLGACEGYSSQSARVEQPVLKSYVSAEKLLQADGFLSFAGLNTNGFSPLQKHAAARARVNPSKTRGHFVYTDYLRRADMMADSGFRSLSLASDAQGFRVASLDVVASMPTAPAPAFKPNAMAVANEFQVASIADVVPVPAAKQDPAMSVAQVSNAALSESLVVRTTAQAVAEMIDRRIATTLANAAQDAFVEEDPAYQETAQIDDHALSVVNMRMGDYEDRTRLVLDLSAAAKFDYDLNNVNSLLTVHINNAGWDLDTQRFFDDHPLIKSYEVSQAKDGESVTLEISLKQPSRMVMSGFVRPDGRRGHRIFFDVAAL